MAKEDKTIYNIRDKNLSNSEIENLLRDRSFLKDVMEIPFIDQKKAAQKINRRIGDASISVQKPIPFYKAFARYAAVFIIVIISAFGFYYFIDNQEVINDSGKEMAVLLPDGTELILGQNSLVSYKRSFSLTNRRIELEGEAYFNVVTDVKHDFLLGFNEDKIVVKGTKFFVRTLGSASEVYLQEGKVLYTSGLTGEEKLLNEGDLLSKMEEHIEVENQRTPETFNNFLPHSVLMENWSIAKAVDYINDYYQREVIRIRDLESAEDCLIRTYFEPGKLDAFIEEIQILFKINMRSYKGGFSIDEINCKS